MAYTTIDDPTAHFQTKLYTGNNTANHAITNDGNSNLQPDLVWMKHRTGNHSHYLVDSSRGRDKGLASDTTAAETTSSSSTQDFQSFDTNGFTVGTVETTDSINAAGGSTLVAWQWKANGGTTTAFSESGNNPGGNRQTNTDAGFSIISYTGTGANASCALAHGLPSAPKFVIFKSRSDTYWWATWHEAIGDDNKLALQSDAAQDADGAFMNSTLPDATNIYVGGTSVHTNKDADNYICYAWSPIQGYSHFGTYVGNGVTDGPFVYTGFKPAFILYKTINAAEGWGILDNKRLGFNVFNNVFSANSNGAEYGGSNYNFMDIYSNGFKCRRATYGPNQNNVTYLYVAFAESPFISSKGVPTTAR